MLNVKIVSSQNHLKSNKIRNSKFQHKSITTKKEYFFKNSFSKCFRILPETINIQSISHENQMPRRETQMYTTVRLSDLNPRICCGGATNFRSQPTCSRDETPLYIGWRRYLKSRKFYRSDHS